MTDKLFGIDVAKPAMPHGATDRKKHNGKIIAYDPDKQQSISSEHVHAVLHTNKNHDTSSFSDREQISIDISDTNAEIYTKDGDR